jgi:hypothetical protein
VRGRNWSIAYWKIGFRVGMMDRVDKEPCRANERLQANLK